MTQFQTIELGDRVRDPITGYQGVAYAVTTWLNGCVRFGVQPEKLDKDGKVQQELWFDQTQLRVVKKRVHVPVALSVSDVPPPKITRERIVAT